MAQSSTARAARWSRWRSAARSSITWAGPTPATRRKGGKANRERLFSPLPCTGERGEDGRSRLPLAEGREVPHQLAGVGLGQQEDIGSARVGDVGVAPLRLTLAIADLQHALARARRDLQHQRRVLEAKE